MTDIHNKLCLSWTGGKTGAGRITSRHVGGDLAMPAGHGGTGQGLDPKSLLAASAAECLILNLVAILEASGVEHGPISIETVAQGSGGAGIAIDHHLTLSLSADGVENDRVGRLIEKAEASCNIGNLLKSAGVPITLTHSTARI